MIPSDCTRSLSLLFPPSAPLPTFRSPTNLLGPQPPFADIAILYPSGSFASCGGAQGHARAIGWAGGCFFCINHMHTHLQKCAHVAHIDRRDDTRAHARFGKSMQINPQAEPCYSINVSAPVISALVRSVRDDSETTSPFNWCHAPLLPPAAD